ncbi:LPXTG cell wall anchor domain-containing protein [Terrabacter terrigena]|uniref:LPXTG cell wall anchor domain-containing protein n=1 Tax=Terrabacter terrigena TaxID=574718 RepID=A0ABW3N0W8_9MICO
MSDSLPATADTPTSLLLILGGLLVALVLVLRESRRARRAEQAEADRRATVRRLHAETATSAVFVASGKFEAIYPCGTCGAVVRSEDPTVLDHLQCAWCANAATGTVLQMPAATR